MTLFGKNSDRKSDECQPLLQFSEAAHPPGAVVRCTHLEIPQVAETYRVLGHSPWWVWGFAQGVNEHAVAIGNHPVFSNEVIEEGPGLIGMDLVRLGLERGSSAREALEVMVGLIERHGQGGAAQAPNGTGYHNSFLIADPLGAWALETSNRRWAARQLGLDGMSNHYGLAADWEIGSRDLETFARGEGWWQEEGRLDVAAAYRNPHVPPHISQGRWRRSRELLRAGRGRHDVASFSRLLRDHGNGSASWDPCGATPDDERYFTVCAHSEPVGVTTASMIAPLPGDRAAPWGVWVGFGTPCTGVFLPVYVDGVIPPSLARAGDEPGEDSAWWVFQRLQCAARTVDGSSREALLLRERWGDLEEAIDRERVEVEARAAKKVHAGDRDSARQLVSTFMSRCVERVLERARLFCAELS